MSEKWAGKNCPVFFQGHLEQRVKRTRFEYRNRTLEYDQEGSWCSLCDEGIVTGTEAASAEMLLDEFMAHVDRDEAAKTHPAP